MSEAFYADDFALREADQVSTIRPEAILLSREAFCDGRFLFTGALF